MAKPKVKATVLSLVQVRIEGEKPKGKTGLPVIRDDGGLVHEFLQWQLDSGVLGVARAGGHSGGGSFCGYFYPEEAGAVAAWLREHGVEVEA